MSEPIIIKRGDTLRILSDTIYFNETVLDLTGHTVVGVFKKGSARVTQVATVDATPTTGKITCFIPADVSSQAGEWNYEWEVTKASDSKRVSIPNKGYNILVVNPNL
jgi:hypothetical protein